MSGIPSLSTEKIKVQYIEENPGIVQSVFVHKVYDITGQTTDACYTIKIIYCGEPHLCGQLPINRRQIRFILL
jgi:hypothetical protein